MATASYLASSTLEKLLEHRFIAKVGTELWTAGIRDFEVLHGEVDAFGYDIAIEANGVFRHIQLKMTRRGGKRANINVNKRLATKPSGCIIWAEYAPETLILGPFRWFGDEPGLPLPEQGDKIARHSKGNASGEKLERPNHRIVTKSRFETIDCIEDLVVKLFGPILNLDGSMASLAILKRHLAKRASSDDPASRAGIRRGIEGDLPPDLVWQNSAETAHFIDGYELVDELGLGDPFAWADTQLEQATKTGKWHGGIAELWSSLFLEHRRWRMSGMEPDSESSALLDRLCTQLYEASADID